MHYTIVVKNTKGAPVASPSLDALPIALSHHSGYLLVRLGKHAQRLFSLEIAPLGLRPAHCDVMLTLAERGALSQTSIADTLVIERAHLVALLDQLEVLELVSRAVDPSDRRRHAVSLTAAGVEMARVVAEIARRVEDNLLQPLTVAERSDLRALLQRLAHDADEGD